MKTFSSIKEAFEFWLSEIYPKLEPEVKRGKYTDTWRNYRHKGGAVSEEKMIEILKEQGLIVKKKITYEP